MSTTAFDEVVFPVGLAFGSTGGPERRTEIVTLGSGRERRNARWADSRRRYDVGSGIRSQADLALVVGFFEERRGRLIGFRFRDPLDDRSCAYGAAPGATDQQLGVGDGTTATFQLVKRYGTASNAWSRTIAKPVSGSVRIAVAGVARTIGVNVTVDTTTGQVSFPPGSLPPSGAAVTAGFLFHVPVRFDTDEIRIDLTHFAAGQIPSIPILEIRP